MNFVSSSSFTGLCSHEDAAKLEVSQLDTSACGATALVNVLLALKVIDKSDQPKLDWSVCTLRTRDYSASLPQYLASRAVAGCTGQDLVDSMGRLTATNGLPEVKGEFISFQSISTEDSSYLDFLHDSIRSRKAVVATLNLQIIGNDAWHHQLIYGIDSCDSKDSAFTSSSSSSTSSSIFCLNPQGAYPSDLFEAFLSSRSVLLIRRQDVLDRIDRPVLSSELSEEQVYSQPLWRQLRVREQLDTMTRSDSTVEYLVVPASYVGGFAVFSKA